MSQIFNKNTINSSPKRRLKQSEEKVENIYNEISTRNFKKLYFMALIH